MNPIEVDIPDDDDLVMNREESNIRGDDPEPTTSVEEQELYDDAQQQGEGEEEEDTNSELKPAAKNYGLSISTGSRGNWTADEDKLLREAVQLFEGRNWKKISVSDV
jgi:hypothetical protein